MIASIGRQTGEKRHKDYCLFCYEPEWTSWLFWLCLCISKFDRHYNHLLKTKAGILASAFPNHVIFKASHLYFSHISSYNHTFYLVIRWGKLYFQCFDFRSKSKINLLAFHHIFLSNIWACYPHYDLQYFPINSSLFPIFQSFLLFLDPLITLSYVFSHTLLLL